MKIFCLRWNQLFLLFLSLFPHMIYGSQGLYYVPVASERPKIIEASTFEISDVTLNNPVKATDRLSFSYSLPLLLTGDETHLKVLAEANITGKIIYDLPTFGIRATIISGPCVAPGELNADPGLPPCVIPDLSDEASFLAIGKGRCRWSLKTDGQKALACKIQYSGIDRIVSKKNRELYIDNEYFDNIVYRDAVKLVAASFGHDAVGELTFPIATPVSLEPSVEP